MNKTWKLYVDGKCVDSVESIEFSDGRKLVMSDTKNKFESLPWNKCEVGFKLKAQFRNCYNGVVISTTDTNEDLLWRKPGGDWSVIFESSRVLKLEVINNATRKIDEWIDVELKKLKEKERAEASKAAPPVLPDWHRLCSREEAANAPSGSVKILIDKEWYSVGDPILMDKMPMIEAVVESGNGIYCTSAPRKFVRCTAQDAVKLSRLGAYVEKAEDGCERIWCRIELAPVTTSLRGCVYRVDRYTIPEDFKLEPVMPTVRLPDGFVWVAIGSKIIAFEKDGLVMEVPSSKYHFDDFLRRQKLRQATLDAYDEIHDVET